MSLHSMTAFARESASGPDAVIVELRSVNHRYLDCHFKLPDSLRALEPKLRDALAKSLKRGKVDCQIRIVDEADRQSLTIDEDRLKAVLGTLRQLQNAAPHLAQPDALAVLQFPGVCEGRADKENSLQASALEAFNQALKTLQESRAREGAQLAQHLQRRIAAVQDEVTRVRSELPALRERQQERLRRRLDELEQPVDPGRLEQELVLILQKSDVDEELDRLEAHVAEVTRILGEGGPCGRRLDFLMQELNREANTLSSKSTAGSTTQSAVELKVLIEQMREQIQNIE
jgi:uncharacterized protein (TIGR00255 family)